MDNLLTKLSAYNILNNMIPGGIACYLLKLCCHIYFFECFKTAEQILVYYFVGLVISRMGSLVVEPVYKFLNIVKFADYDKFLEAETKDNKIPILNQENNFYRTLIMMCMVVICLRINIIIETMQNICICNDSILLVMLGLFILFSLAYRKNTAYIRKRVENYHKNKLIN